MEFIEKLYHENTEDSARYIGDLRLYCCGRRLGAPNHRFGPSDRAHYWLIFLKEGSGYYETEGIRYRLEKGCLFIAYPNRRIRYYADPGSVWSIYWVSIDEAVFDTYLTEMGITESNPVLPIRSPSELERTFEALLNAIPDETLASRFLCVSMLYKLLSQIAPAEKATVSKRDYVEEAIFFMTSHSSEHITGVDIANTVGLDISYFSRVFKKRTGMRPIAWLNRYRLDRASVLLTETDMKINEIALSVGFDDPLYFSRKYTEYFGISPSQWRKQKYT